MRHLVLYSIAAALVITIGSCKSKSEHGPEPSETAPATTVKDNNVEPAAPKKTKTATLAFFEAALNGDTQTVESELLDGVNPNAVNPDEHTALMLAAFNGHTDIVDLLITYGSEVNQTDSLGRTALMFAVTGPYAETVKLLLRKGASVNTIDGGEKWTALMFAAAEGQAEVVKVLLENGADWTLKDVDGDTAANFAANNGHTQVVQIIRDHARQNTDK